MINNLGLIPFQISFFIIVFPYNSLNNFHCFINNHYVLTENSAECHKPQLSGISASKEKKKI